MTVVHRSLAGAAIGALALPLAGLAQAPVRAMTARPAPVSVLHVIEAVDLQASPGGATEGQAVTFRFKMKNTGTTASVQIPWVLQVDGAPVGNGTHPGLKPGESWEGTKGWTALPGSRVVRFVIDPAATAWATGAPAAARSRQLAYSVAALSATEVRLIDWDAAKAVGMNYANGLIQPTMCAGILEPISHAAYISNVPSLPQYVGWIHVRLQCPLGSGGRMNGVVYDNMVLKNGWHVKDVQVNRLYQSGRSDWQFSAAPPGAGSDRPKTSLRLWADKASAVELALKVEIEGPRGTNPYR